MKTTIKLCIITLLINIATLLKGENMLNIVSDLKVKNDKEPEIICNSVLIKFYKFTKKLKIRLKL